MHKKGWVAVGLDEVGRGALCGPVVACAFMFKDWDFRGVKDSKKLSFKKREELYKLLKGHPATKWGLGRVYPKVIDRINILEATKLAMERAIEKLKRKEPLLDKKGIFLLDGNFKLDLDILQEAIVKADEKIASCSAASIVAKVSRDRMMLRYHKKYPKYKLGRHKGYPTELHRERIREYGPSFIHRLTFRGVMNPGNDKKSV